MQNGNKKPNYKCKIKTDVQFCWDLFFSLHKQLCCCWYLYF